MKYLSLAFVLLTASLAHAASGLYDARTQTQVDPRSVFSQARPGSIWIVSEFHNNPTHHAHQKVALELLAQTVPHVSTGFEFYETPQQDLVDQYVSGALPEADFLKAIGWGSLPFDYYRAQTVFPESHGGYTVALNAPRSLASRVAQVGVAGLTASERAELPPDFELGNALYRERFDRTMSEGHVPPDALARYFEAQSLWDDTMAHSAIEFMRSHPEQVLMILVGDFHAAYGGGLPDRLRARGAQDLHVVSQALDPAELTPDPRYGVKGDYVWLP